MNFQFYYEKLLNSKEYKDFIKKNPNAYPCSSLFILDRETGGKGNSFHFDFWLPVEKKMNSFKVGEEIQFSEVENFDSRPFEEISVNHDFSFEDIEEMILKKMSEEAVTGRVQKILFSLQKLNGKEFLVITAFLNNLGLLKINFSLDDMKIISFEKKSFFEMFKVFKKEKKD
ncbi:MAG: hypothetical protein NUV46_02750 [Nanoarchaeota archaeon]|nr:hypothetical protein [Nanoarchaeota archaeon]